MTYQPIPYESVKPECEKAFKHANMYLHDVYGIMRGLPPAGGDGGAGNFIAALALLALLDAFASFQFESSKWKSGSIGAPRAAAYAVRPTLCGTCSRYMTALDSISGRFIHLVRDNLAWDNGGAGWLRKCCGTRYMWKHFRSSLVHNIALDDNVTKKELVDLGLGEPIVGKWGLIPESERSIEALDRSCPGLPGWPVLYEKKDESGELVPKMCVAALYLATKDLIWRSAEANR